MGNKTGVDGIIPQNLGAMSREEQDTLLAQTEAMKKLGMLPPANNAPQMNEPPPNIPQNDFRVPPPGNTPPFNQPPPFGGPPPTNGFYQQPPPFNNRGGDYHSNGRGNNGYRGYRSGGPPQRGGYRDNYNNGRNNYRRYDDHKGGPRPCKFWVDRGHCRDGDNCRYSHDKPLSARD